MVPCCFDDGFRAGCSNESAIRQNGVGGEDAFGGTGDEGEDVGVRDQDDTDASLDERFLEGVDVHFIEGIVVPRDYGVCFGMGVGVAFGVDDGELSFCGCFEEEALDGKASSVGKDSLGGMDVVDGVVGDLVVGLVEFIDDFGDAVEYFGAKVKVCLRLLRSRSARRNRGRSFESAHGRMGNNAEHGGHRSQWRRAPSRSGGYLRPLGSSRISW